MRLLVGLVLFAATPALAAEPAPRTAYGGQTPIAGRVDCPGAGQVTPAAQARVRPRVWKLTEPPPADMLLTVMRRIDGCPVPVIVRYGVDRQPQERDRTPGR